MNFFRSAFLSSGVKTVSASGSLRSILTALRTYLSDGALPSMTSLAKGVLPPRLATILRVRRSNSSRDSLVCVALSMSSWYSARDVPSSTTWFTCSEATSAPLMSCSEGESCQR